LKELMEHIEELEYKDETVSLYETPIECDSSLYETAEDS
jgi:hypothetical protein